MPGGLCHQRPEHRGRWVLFGDGGWYENNRRSIFVNLCLSWLSAYTLDGSRGLSFDSLWCSSHFPDLCQSNPKKKRKTFTCKHTSKTNTSCENTGLKSNLLEWGQRNICLLLQTVMEESNWLYCRRLQPQARLAVAAPIEGLQARRHWGPSLLCTRWEICGHDIILFPQWVSLYVSVASSYVYRVPKSIGAEARVIKGSAVTVTVW